MAKLYETAELEAELFEESAEVENFSDEMIESVEEFPALELMLELADGRTLEYELAGVFVHREKEYAVLHPKTDTEGIIHLMELAQGEEDEIKLLPVSDDLWNEVEEAFHKFFNIESYGESEIIEFEDNYEENDEIKGE